jgi:hypothetical protein
MLIMKERRLASARSMLAILSWRPNCPPVSSQCRDFVLSRQRVRNRKDQRSGEGPQPRD